ncbi:uncharacterized protein LOC119394932 [Rhipicephalus sanguineus]|uniref:uncharacterized protein LOC119394932 n=1 Tax=Rhipicephalus sanguineus TaxID=34632 RepID=UPI001895362C|nr:uncharacterized protein LOC119394932 [Rhipicephalus sanguineus]
MAEAIESGAPTFQIEDSGGAVEAVEQKLEVFELVPSYPNADASGQLWPAGPSATYDRAPQGFNGAVCHSQFLPAPAASPWTPVTPGWFPAYPVPYFLVPRHYPVPPPPHLAPQPRRSVPYFPDGVVPPNFFVPRLAPAPTTSVPNMVFPNCWPQPPMATVATAIPTVSSPNSLVPVQPFASTVPNVAPPPTFLVPQSPPLARSAMTPQVNVRAFGAQAPWFAQPPIPAGPVVRFGAGGAKPSSYEVQRLQGAPLFMMRSRTRKKLQQPQPASGTPPPRPHLQR